MANPEEIDLGDEDDLGGDEVPDDGDTAELEADDGVTVAAAATVAEATPGISTASEPVPEQSRGDPARQDLHASLAALQPAGYNGRQAASGVPFNPEDIELPDD